MSKKSEKETAKAEAIKRLRKIKPGTTVYGIVRKVSGSGMSRTIDFYAVDRKDGSLDYLTGYFAHVLEWSRTPQGALRVAGCGMDMIFHTIYSAAEVTFRGTAQHARWAAKIKAEDAARGRTGNGRPTSPGYMWKSDRL